VESDGNRESAVQVLLGLLDSPGGIRALRRDSTLLEALQSVSHAGNAGGGGIDELSCGARQLLAIQQALSR
jgi:hypothetical protein